jgi:hypothetical protein
VPLSLRLLAIVKSGLVRHLSSQVKTLLKDIEQLIGKLNTFCTRAAALRVSFPLWATPTCTLHLPRPTRLSHWRTLHWRTLHWAPS